MGKKKKLKKALEKFFDVKLDDIELTVCDCEGHQVCDICQGVVDGDGSLDNIQCELCGEFKQPDKFISIEDLHCHTCHDKMHEAEPINQGHYFELMDRTHMVQCIIDDHIANHPAMTPNIKDEIDTVQEYLTDVYQWAARMHENFEGK